MADNKKVFYKKGHMDTKIFFRPEFEELYNVYFSDVILIVSDEEEISRLSLNGSTMNAIWIQEDIQKEVPWQEAIAAWIDGKTIKAIIDSDMYVYKGGYNILTDEYSDGVDRKCFKNGTWYIVN